MNLRPWRGTPSHRASTDRQDPAAAERLLAMIGPVYHAAYSELLESKVTAAQVEAMVTVAKTTLANADAQYAAENREAAAGLFGFAREFFGDAALSAHRLMATRLEMHAFLGVAEAGTRLLSLRLSCRLSLDELRDEAAMHAGTALGHFRHVRETDAMVRAYLILGRLSLCDQDLPQALAFFQRARSAAALAGLADLMVESQALHRFTAALAPSEPPSGSRLRVDAPAIVVPAGRVPGSASRPPSPGDADQTTQGAA